LLISGERRASDRAEEHGVSVLITKPVDFDAVKAQLRELPTSPA
jgi:hypothetical protein